MNMIQKEKRNMMRNRLFSTYFLAVRKLHIQHFNSFIVLYRDVFNQEQQHNDT
jgi:hypothetical protein